MRDLSSSKCGLVLVSVGLVLTIAGCKEKKTEPATTTAALAPAVPAIPAAPAAPATGNAATKNAQPAPVASAKLARVEKNTGGKTKAHELSILDPSSPNEGIVTCGDRDIVVVLPLFLGAPDWKVQVDKGLAAPKRNVRERCLGPNTHCEEFRWSGLDTPAGAYEARFTSGSDKVTVPIRIDARMECED